MELVEKEGAVVVAAQVLRERAEQCVELAGDKEHVLHVLRTVRGAGGQGGEHEDQEEEVAERRELPCHGVEGGQEGDQRLADAVENGAELTGVAGRRREEEGEEGRQALVALPPLHDHAQALRDGVRRVGEHLRRESVAEEQRHGAVDEGEEGEGCGGGGGVGEHGDEWIDRVRLEEEERHLDALALHRGRKGV